MNGPRLARITIGLGALVWSTVAIAQSPGPAVAQVESQVDRAAIAPRDAIGVQRRTEPGVQPGPTPEETLETQLVIGDLQSPPVTYWLGDILVTDPSRDQADPALANAPDGTLFIAVEEYGALDGWVRVYRSKNGGTSWVYLFQVRTGITARNPSLSYVERTSGEKWLFLAYEAEFSSGSKDIVVVRFDPDNFAWTSVSAVSGITGMSDVYPRISTDILIYDDYYVYLTYAANFIDYYPVMFTRSTDGGQTFETPQNLTDGAENSSFVTRPDITYGTAGLFVAFEKSGWTGSAWETQVWVTRSTSFGFSGSWTSPVQLTTSSYGAWHPSVAAAIGVQTVMVAYTRGLSSDTNIECAYSTDGGSNYVLNNPLPWTSDEEVSVDLAVSQFTGRYHAAFWRNYDIRYTWTDATSPLPWAGTTLINEANFASLTYSQPAICIDPTKPGESEACVAWTDFREGYNVYFDAGFHTGACCLADDTCMETLESDCLELEGTWQGAGTGCDPNPCLFDPCDEDLAAPDALLPSSDFHCVPAGAASAIVGTATDPEDNLELWQLEERGMGSSPWGTLASSAIPKENEVLTNWTPAAAGYRMLRLTADDKCGHASSAVRLMYADQGPNATINYPNSGQVIGGNAVCIDGRVSHGVCSMAWTAAYRPAAGAWVDLAGGSTAIRNLALTHWDTTTVPDGAYEVRAQSTSIGGSVQDTVAVTVDNTPPTVQLDDPIDCSWVDGVVQIYGSAFDANLSQWKLYWTGGGSSGWNLIQSGVTSASGLLANWDVSGLPHCAYTVRLVAHDEARINCTNDVHTSTYLVSLQVGEPPSDADLDGDGDVDLEDYQLFVLAFTGPT